MDVVECNSMKFIKIRLPSGVTALLLLLFLILFLLFTEPSDENFSLSFIPLVLAWFVSFFTVSTVLRAFIKSMSRGMTRMISSSFASAAVLLIMFSALGQLGVFDITLLISLVVLGIFYFSRTWPK